jgi:hypothetical protein
MKRFYKVFILLTFITTDNVFSQMFVDSLRVINNLPISTLDTIHIRAYCFSGELTGVTSKSLSINGSTIEAFINTCASSGVPAITNLTVSFKVNPLSQGQYKLKSLLTGLYIPFGSTVCSSPNGIDKDSINFSVVQANGIKESEVFSKVSLSPNPSNGVITIINSGALLLKGNLLISDVTGRMISEIEVDIENSQSQIMNIEKLKNGIYFFKIKLDNGNSKIYKQIIYQ